MKYKNLLFFLGITSCMLTMSVDPTIDNTTYVASYKNKYEKRIRELLKDAYQLDDISVKKYGEKHDQFSFAFGQNDEIPPVDLVLMRNNKVIGFASFDMNPFSLDGRIYMICIDKNYRGQGLGKKFLLKILEKHKESGMKTVSLKAHKVANSAAIKLYEKLGFKKIGQELEGALIDFKKVL